MKKLALLLLPTLAFGQALNVQVNTSGNLIRPSTGFNFTSGQTFLASSGATINFSAATVALPAASAIPPPASPTEGDLLVYHSGAWGKISAGTSGYALVSNGAAALPSYQAVAGSGTVTSVAQTVPAGFAISGSPVTASGTLAITYATGQTANKFLATPDGTTGAFSERSIVTSDLPTSGVTAATYGDATHSAQIAVDATGRITSASNVAISGGGGGIGGSTGSTDNAILRADGTGGATVQASGVTIDDTPTSFFFPSNAGMSAGGSNHNVVMTSTGTGSTIALGSSSATSSVPLIVRSSDPGTSLANELVLDNGHGAGNIKSQISFSSQMALKWVFGNDYNSDGTQTFFIYDAIAADFREQINASGFFRWKAYGAGALTTDSSGNITAASDARLKNIQGDFTRGLHDLLKLNPILYKWNEKSGNEMETTYAGFTAQNVQSAIPEAVGQMKDGYLTLQDRPIIAALVNANRELYYELRILWCLVIIFVISFSLGYVGLMKKK